MSPAIAACLKWVDLRATVDPLSGEIHSDLRSAGSSPADQAALEIALTLGQAWQWAVVAITAGPAGADSVLRQAMAAGATRGVRVAVDAGQTSDVVAAAVARALPDGVALVCCGAWSVDRGSGSVPAFLAARIGAAQALGLLSVEPTSETPTQLRAERRLDGGRRERLEVSLPAVISVEAGTARLRRASLAGVRHAGGSVIDVVVPDDRPPPASPVIVSPYRPRARALPGPSGSSARQRVLELTGAGSERPSAQVLILPPDEAACAVIKQLRAWGYLP